MDCLDCVCVFYFPRSYKFHFFNENYTMTNSTVLNNWEKEDILTFSTATCFDAFSVSLSLFFSSFFFSFSFWGKEIKALANTQ